MTTLRIKWCRCKSTTRSQWYSSLIFPEQRYRQSPTLLTVGLQLLSSQLDRQCRAEKNKILLVKLVRDTGLSVNLQSHKIWISMSHLANFSQLPLATSCSQAIFSQTWLRYVWLMLSQIRLSVVCGVRAPYSGGLTFRGYFCTILQPGHPATHPPKITKIVQPMGALNARR